jgi:broad specificity phosphatase PhoE
MSTTVFLVRHGQTTSNITHCYSGWSDEDLNEAGYMQARSLSSRLAGLHIGSVYTSPLRRTHTTATILAEPHRLGVKALDDLIEIQLGDWQGLHEEEIERKWPELWKQSRIDPSEIVLPSGESFGQVVKRAIRAFEMILGASSGGQTLIVTHDIVVRILVAYVLGVPYSIYRRLDIDNASLSIIRATDGRKQLVTLNDTAHLEGLPVS